MRHPRDMGAAEVDSFLNIITNERQVSQSIHNQALSAVLFLYREVLGVDLPWLNGLNRPAQKKRIPIVLTRDEVTALFSFLGGDMALLAKLLLCHASASVRHRHPHRARAVGAFGCIHHHDGYPCAQGGSGWHGQPAGCAAYRPSTAYKRTGIPRSAMRSLACRTVY